MAIESTTLYKLIILYMLNKVNFPLTNSQISEFFLEKNYTSYFTLQQVITELVDSHLISIETVRNSSYYHITSEGSETLGFFGNKIPGAIVDDMDIYLISLDIFDYEDKDRRYDVLSADDIMKLQMILCASNI